MVAGDLTLSVLDRFGFRPLERLRIVAPLGIRFWDPAREAAVTDGLVVTARPEGSRRPGRRAYRTPSGVYAFRGLPGLRDVEYPADDVTGLASPPLARRFVLEVADGPGRFLPVTVLVDLPHRGLYPPGEPVGGPPGFALFSAPTRPVTATLAAVRAQLETRLDAVTRRPAAHAVLEVRVLGQPAQPRWYGIADERGAVAVLFPYPTFTGGPTAASPLAAPPGAGRQRWQLAIGVRHAPAGLVVPPGSNQPELRGIVAQAPALIWPSAAGFAPPTFELLTELVVSEELVLRTDAGPTLLIGPAGSPP